MADPLRIRKTGRRVQTEPTPGYLGEPAARDDESAQADEPVGASGEGNDERLLRDKPPHWG